MARNEDLIAVGQVDNDEEDERDPCAPGLEGSSPGELLVAVNALGCLVIGFLAGLAETRTAFTSEARLFLFVGILGGFTTFSSYGLQTFTLLRDGEIGWAAVNIAASNVFGLFMVWTGYVVSKAL